MTALGGDPGRIERFLGDVASVGRDPRGGWTRLAFSEEERDAHGVFARWAEDLGFTVWTDSMGNSYGELPGKGSGNRQVLATGSHLDTVPQGGNFDGAAGVAAALEVGRIIKEEGGLNSNLRLVVFAGEEGARFGLPCIGSRVITGSLSVEDLESVVDRNGATVLDCAESVRLKPHGAAHEVWQSDDLRAFIELHIEQGRVLQETAKAIGVVNCIGGSTRIRVSFTGRADHSGATPMWLRKDALACACEFGVEVEREAFGHSTSVATVGWMEVLPGSLTTVPGAVELGLDIRDIDSEKQREIAERLLDHAQRISRRRGLHVAADLLSDQSPLVLHKWTRDALVEEVDGLGAAFQVMPSGASHDSAHVAKVAPTGMIFVPSRGGISHAPEEWSEFSDIALGATVIARALRRLDGPQHEE